MKLTSKLLKIRLIFAVLHIYLFILCVGGWVYGGQRTACWSRSSSLILLSPQPFCQGFMFAMLALNSDLPPTPKCLVYRYAPPALVLAFRLLSLLTWRLPTRIWLSHITYYRWFHYKNKCTINSTKGEVFFVCFVFCDDLYTYSDKLRRPIAFVFVTESKGTNLEALRRNWNRSRR